MNIERTKKYYEEDANAEACDCEYCKNYREKIKEAYPQLAEHLQSYGVDIEMPFETMPLDPDEENKIEYVAAQYVVFGDPKKFQNTTVSDVEIRLAESHPTTNIEEEHFIIELMSINLEAGESQKQSGDNMVLGMAIGTMIGTAIGAAYDNTALGSSMGLMLGMTIGLIFD